ATANAPGTWAASVTAPLANVPAHVVAAEKALGVERCAASVVVPDFKRVVDAACAATRLHVEVCLPACVRVALEAQQPIICKVPSRRLFPLLLCWQPIGAAIAVAEPGRHCFCIDCGH